MFLPTRYVLQWAAYCLLQGKVRKCFLGFVRRQAEKGDEAFLLSLCSQMPACRYPGGVYAAPHRLVDICPEFTSGLHVILLISSPPWDNHCHCVVGFLSWFFSLGLMSNFDIYPGSGLVFLSFFAFSLGGHIDSWGFLYSLYAASSHVSALWAWQLSWALAYYIQLTGAHTYLGIFCTLSWAKPKIISFFFFFFTFSISILYEQKSESIPCLIFLFVSSPHFQSLSSPADFASYFLTPLCPFL